MKDRAYLQKAALKQLKADLVLKGGNVINVFTDEILVGDVAIVDDTIVGIGNYSGEKEIDCAGKYIIPGLIDAHIHIESTMLLPSELSKVLLRLGTTTLIADPHELVNVKGADGLEFFYNATENVGMDVYVMVPSSVPATPYDTNGAGEFLAEDMVKFVDLPRVLGLGEVMCFREAIAAEPKTLKKLELFKNKYADGHSIKISPKEMNSYRLAGVGNDHECITFDEAYRKMRAGFNIFIREGSGAKNLSEIIKGLLREKLPFDQCAFCTDDKHLDDIIEEGHVNYCVKKAIALGVHPVTAIKMASYNPARFYNLRRLGAVAAGYQADVAVVDDLRAMQPSLVLKSGKVVGEDFFEPKKTDFSNMLNTVKFEPLTKDKLKLKPEYFEHVIGVIPNQIATLHLKERVPVENGEFAPQGDYLKICVVERHGKNGNVGVAALKGFGLKNGAIATSVSHDSHNVIAVGDNDDDIIAAVNRLKEIGGGYAVSRGGKTECMPLEIAGLVSSLDWETLREKSHKLFSLAKSMGVTDGVDPFTTLSFMALPVIPEIRILDTGLFDVDKFEMIK